MFLAAYSTSYFSIIYCIYICNAQPYIYYTHSIIQELQDSYDIWNYYIDIHCNIYIAIHTLKCSTYCGWYHVYVIPIRSQGVDTPRKTSAQAHDSSQALSSLRQRIKELNTQQLGEGLTWRRRLGCFVVSRGMALRDIQTCFVTCRKWFCVAGGVVLRRSQKMRCIFRGTRSTLDVSIVILRGRRSTLDLSCGLFLRTALSGLRPVVTTCKFRGRHGIL